MLRHHEQMLKSHNLAGHTYVYNPNSLAKLMIEMVSVFVAVKDGQRSFLDPYVRQ